MNRPCNVEFTFAERHTGGNAKGIGKHLSPACPPTGRFWMGSAPPSFRPGWGRDSTPAGGTDGGPCRRPGGPAPKRWQRRPTSLAGHSADSAAKPTGIDRGDRPPSGQHPGDRADRGDLRTPNRERCRSGGGVTGDRRGRSTPRQPRCMKRGRRNTEGLNHGRRSRKSNWDCTICHSYRWRTIGFSRLKTAGMR